MNTIVKSSIVIAVFTVISFGALAQFAFGLKGGLNLSSIDLKDPQATYNARTGYHAGIFLRGKFDKVAIQPEVLLYVNNGEISSSLIGTAQESFTYLTVPVMFKFYPLGGLNIQVGPQFSYLLDGQRNYNSRLIGISGSQDITNYYKNTDVAVSAGLGYDFGFGLNLDARYNIGVKDINNDVNGQEAKSRVFLVSIGWNFIR